MKKEKNMFDLLKEHLDNTPKEELMKEWEKTKKFDKVGHTVDEYFNTMKEIEKFKNSVGD